MSQPAVTSTKEVTLNDIRQPNPFGQLAEHNQGNALAMTEQHRAMAEVQGMMIIAKKFPRDERTAVDRILNAFSRPSLADVAKYQYSRGGSSIDGPSIRAAEAIAQQWGNIDFGFREITRGIGSDGVPYSEIDAYAWDLQTMTRRSVQFRVRHWRDTKSGGYALKDERDIYELTANMAQRRVRACILATIPGDVVESAMNQAEITLRTTADTSAEAMAKVVEAFAQYGVTKSQIEKKIQRRLDAIVPAQVVTLRKIYASLRDGMSNADEWFDPEEETAKTTDLSAMRSHKGATTAKTTTTAEKAEASKPAQQPAEQAQAANDAQSGDIFEEKPDQDIIEPVMKYAEVASMLEKANDMASLEMAADNIQYVKNVDHQNELGAIFKRKLNEFKENDKP
ncbi:hypothetical protein [Methylovorus glucosotrophus]|uniref:Uncharacterized protein n=1 Tax=Methylovorus glucosotrophus (strain SIP3-4) TaxID=582744 RepID=C6XED1_METGS|nr:hypothetical protein [Methylovorus glucosotrophus]ACT50906.1 conserved hypothetical protein [Methylovorus glucosotrophus SIP3-4]